MGSCSYQAIAFNSPRTGTLLTSQLLPRSLLRVYNTFSKNNSTPVFMAAMSTIAKLWKEPRCPLTDEWIKKMWCTHTHTHTHTHTEEYYSAIKKNEILPSATSMELEGIMLSESRSEKGKYHMISLM